MAKRQSKVDLILSEARERLAKAQNKMIDAQATAAIAEAVYNAAAEAYYALERQLAPKPRKKAVKEVPKEPEKTKQIMCEVCAQPEDHPDHDTTYLSSHPFAPSVLKKSGRKAGVSSSTQNTGVETVSALVAGATGD